MLLLIELNILLFSTCCTCSTSLYCANFHCVLYWGSRNRRIWGMVLMGPREEKLGEESQIWLMMYWAKLTPPTLVL